MSVCLTLNKMIKKMYERMKNDKKLAPQTSYNSFLIIYQGSHNDQWRGFGLKRVCEVEATHYIIQNGVK